MPTSTNQSCEKNDLFQRAINLYEKGDYDSIISLSKLNKKIGYLNKDHFKPNMFQAKEHRILIPIIMKTVIFIF